MSSFESIGLIAPAKAVVLSPKSARIGSIMVSISIFWLAAAGLDDELSALIHYADPD